MHIPFVPLGRPKSASIVDAGPLSVGVPLEGTDTVPGLRSLERQAAARRIEGLLGVAAANGFAPGRKYARYRGPLIENLTLDDLKASPRSWAEFLGVSGRWSRWKERKRKRSKKDNDVDENDEDNSEPSSSSPPPPPPPRYTLPISVLSLRERAEENVVAFLPNYLRCAAALVVALAAFGKTPGPLSLAGVAALSAFAWAHARGLLGGPSFAEALAKHQQALIEQQQQQQQQQQAAGGGNGGGSSDGGGGVRSAFRAALRPAPSQEQTPPRRAAATILAYGIAAYTRAFAPLTRGLFWGILLSALHACLRVAATERSAWSSTFSDSSSSTRYVAGVPFWDVVFGAPKPQQRPPPPQQQQRQQQQQRRGGGGGQTQQQQPDDPRRCLRELAAAARALASAAAIGVRAGAAAALDSARARVKGLFQQQQQQQTRRR